MIKASELARGSIVAINGAPYAVEELHVSTPSARGAASLWRLRFRNLVDKSKVDQVCKGDDKFDEVDFERREVQYLYQERGGVYTFMDTDSFEQFSLNADELGDQALYLVEEMEGIFALHVNGKPVAIELPQVVTLKIAECEPTMHGQTVTARAKSAKTSTGLTVQVPEYITAGESVRIDTRTGEFQGRA